MSFLEARDLSKTYGQNTVLHHFDMGIERGEFVTFLGPSGCGKTTTLRIIAGFETPTTGRVVIAGRDVTGLRPNQRKIGMVFQAYALFPNMTVAQNVAFGLKVAGRPQAEIDKRVKEMLELIKLPALAARYPYQLSGGQQQRVALARALATKPELLLLDEPLSALDAKIRVSLRDEIKALQRELGVTTVFVTHDQEEALSMSDRIVVMNEGRVEQVGTPIEIYNRPTTRFVASFVGTLNVLEGQVVDAAAGRLTVAGQEVTTTHPVPAAGTRTLAIRPEAIVLNDPTPGRNRLQGVLEDVNFLGSVVRARIRVGDALLSLDSFNDPALPPPAKGQPASIGFSREALLVLADG